MQEEANFCRSCGANANESQQGDTQSNAGAVKSNKASRVVLTAGVHKLKRITYQNQNKDIPGTFRYIKSSVGKGMSSLRQMLKDPKQMIPMLVLSAFWLVLSILPVLGINPKPVRVLSFLTFAQGGMYNGTIGAIGGIIGKAVFAYFISSLIIPVFFGRNPFKGAGRGLKGFASGIAVQSMHAAASLIIGIGMALIAFNFFTGNASLVNGMAGITGFILAIKSLSKKGGFLWGLLLSMASSLSKGRIPNQTAVNRIISGYAVGSAAGIGLSALQLPYIPYILGVLLLILGLILGIAGKSKKGATAIAAMLFIILSLPMTAAADFLDVDADPPVVAPAGSFECHYNTRMDFSTSGGTLTGAKWVFVPGSVIYTLNGSCKSGDSVSLSVTGTQSPVPDENDKADLVFNNLTVTLSFLDSNQKVIGEVKKYFSENVKEPSLSYDMKGVVPSEAKTVKIAGTFVCRWATPHAVAEESVSVNVVLKVEEEPAAALPAVQETEQKPEPEPSSTPSTTAPRQTPADVSDENQTPDNDTPGHATPLETIIIAIAAVVAAIIGGTAGAASSGLAGAASAAADDVAAAEAGLDPAYKYANIPEYPDTVKGSDGESLSKKPDGTVEARHPNGEVYTYYPNGTIQVRRPDGSTYEEWPDGTVSSTTTDGEFITQAPDGTQTQRRPNGEEVVFRPDGTSVEVNNKGIKITRNENGDTVSAENEEGFVMTRDPEDPDARIYTSPYGGSVKLKYENKYIASRDSEGRVRQTLELQLVAEGEMRIPNGTISYTPDGKVELRNDDGSRVVDYGNGNIEVEAADGSKYIEREDGSFNLEGADGLTAKGNAYTGEGEYNIPDGSYLKVDAEGNVSGADTEEGLEFVARKDGYRSIGNRDGDIRIQHPDGSMEAKASNGWSVSQRADGSATINTPEGVVLTVNTDGSKTMSNPDGTLTYQAKDGAIAVHKTDGTVEHYTEKEYTDMKNNQKMQG